MLAESHDEEQIFAGVAALDIGKAELVCCVRVPAPVGNKRRLQEVTTHSTMTRALTELAIRLVELRVVPASRSRGSLVPQGKWRRERKPRAENIVSKSGWVLAVVAGPGHP